MKLFLLALIWTIFFIFFQEFFSFVTKNRIAIFRVFNINNIIHYSFNIFS